MAKNTSSTETSHPSSDAKSITRRGRGTFGRFTRSRRGSVLLHLLEIALVVCWAFYVGRVMLDRDPNTLNFGGDNVSAYGRFFWDHLRSCGTCALWSGDARGGNPVYIDPNADSFHPIVAIPALILGTLQGFKFSIILCLVMGGLACWWLALELGVHAIARVAAGCIGASGGYLVGRSAQGLVVAMTSIAASALLLAALFRLRRLPTRRSAALLGIVFGLFIISGQGYVQIGMIILSPIFLILLSGKLLHWRLYFLRTFQALVMGILLGSIFLFPFLRYYPSFTKLLDQGFGDHQKFRFLVLNLVLNDRSYYESGAFDMKPFAGYHSNYLGWAVIIFAVIGGAVLWQHSKPAFLVLMLFTLGALWLGTGTPFQLVTQHWLPERVRYFGFSMRNPGWIAMAAAPAIIGLASVGIDAGLHRLPPTSVHRPTKAFWGWLDRGIIITVRLATVGLLLIGLRNLEHGAQQWLTLTKVDPDKMTTILDAVSTSELAWVSPTLGDWDIQMVAYDHGLKLSDGWRPWDIAGFGSKPPTYVAFRYEGEYLPDEDFGPGNSTPFGLIYHSLSPNQYATSSSGGLCSAQGEGGKISVTCDVPDSGILTVQESAYNGWAATVDGQPTPVTNTSSWISVPIPAGESTIELRYRPWDFWVGLVMTSIGLAFALTCLLIPAKYRFAVTFRNRFSPVGMRTGSNTSIG